MWVSRAPVTAPVVAHTLIISHRLGPDPKSVPFFMGSQALRILRGREKNSAFSGDFIEAFLHTGHYQATTTLSGNKIWSQMAVANAKGRTAGAVGGCIRRGSLRKYYALCSQSHRLTVLRGVGDSPNI